MKPENFKKRALCLWLPHWSIQRLYSDRPELRSAPLAIYEEHRPGLFRIVDCCPAARQQGVRPLMPLTEAAAIANPHVEKFDPVQDQLSLKRLAEWSEQFSPTVAIEEPDCLFMDVTGLEPIFGSEQLLVTRMRQAFQSRRLTTQIAITDTYAAAWALAHCSGRAVVIVPPGDVYDWIFSLPIAGLNLTAQIEATLLELGVQTIGELAALPRTSLASRFDESLLKRLDQMMGERREAVNFHYAQPELTRSLEFAGPVSDRATLGAAIIELLSQVVLLLSDEQKGITKFTCEFTGESPIVCMVIRLYQPTINIRHLGELALLQLEQLKFSGSIDKVRLLVCSTTRMRVEQLALFDEENLSEQKHQLSILLNRLSSRLGPMAVLRPIFVADAQAEFAYRYQTFTEGCERTKSKPVKYSGPLQRPIYLLPRKVPLQVLGVMQGPPSQFYWKGETYEVKRAWGPERIQAGWWRGQYEKRDYYRVETADGNRYWLFCRGDGAWFLHGIFD